MRPFPLLSASVFALAAALTLAVGAPSQAQPATPAAAPQIPSQLPRNVHPLHYTIAATPDAQNLRFTGSVQIDIAVTEATDTIVLNAVDMTFSRVTLDGSIEGLATMDAEAQTATLHFPSAIRPGNHRLSIDYAGKIYTQAAGFFALDYPADGGQKRALFTQFEAPDARRFFPGWDEPNFRTPYDLSVTIPAGQQAIGNMPEARRTTNADGTVTVTFQTTPAMSSYLLFLAVGELDRITTRAAGVEVGVVTRRGAGEQGRWALESAARILPWYNEYFGTPFPLPKLDNVAGPGTSQFFGAMENWGAIFSFENILLVDPAITTPARQQSIFEVAAHEMAHQWFGDLVTMAWWDDLWLNEGFASWMASKTTQHFHPDWGADVDQVESREGALGIDAYATTHPIVQTVRTVEQANQAFDTITYSKGESVLTMLEGFAGSDVWQKGIQAYIAAHKYRNTRTDDLWHAVEAAGAAGITQIAHDFTLQPGVPLIRVGASTCAGGSTAVSLTQAQFSADKPDAKPLSWHVPVRATTVGGTAATTIIANGSGRMTVAGCAPLLINAGQTGYYRTLYQPDQIAALTKAYATLGPVDQYGLLADNLALARADYQPMAVGLDLLASVPADAQAKVTALALEEWGALYELFEGDAATQARIAADMSARFGPVLQRLGTVPRKGEPVLDATLRPELIRMLGHIADPAVVAEARRLFADPAAIPGSLKSAWLRVVAENADAATWDRLHALARSASGAVERSTYYGLLGRTRDAALAQRALDLSITDEPGPTISSAMIGAVATKHSELALDFVLAHLDRVRQLTDTSGWSRFIARLGMDSQTPSTIDKLDAYADAHVAASDRKPIDQTIALLRTRFARQARLQSETQAWLAAHKS
jgi:aminopeptidase N